MSTAPAGGPSRAVSAEPPVPGAPPSVIEVRGLVKRRGGTVAVNGLDLVQQAGTVLALLGPNGAGKTTTVEICEGFLRPDSGTVRVLGLDPIRQSGALRPRIGVMPQGGGAYPGVRAGEMLHLVASCAAHPLDVSWLLDVLGLRDALRVPYKRLSGGQQQRLSLACAVVGRPELVFLDEPTAGLDPQARRLVWQLIGALRSDGVGVLLTTHLMDEAEALADHVVIIDRGAAVASGTPAELTAGTGNAALLTFTAPAGLPVPDLLAALPDGCTAEEAPPGRYAVRGALGPREVSAVTGWCAEHDVLAEDLKVARRSLEDVFLDLTGRELRP